MHDHGSKKRRLSSEDDEDTSKKLKEEEVAKEEEAVLSEYGDEDKENNKPIEFVHDHHLSHHSYHYMAYNDRSIIILAPDISFFI